MRKPPKGKSLAELNPELAKEWHPTKNGELTPYDVFSGSGIKIWWKCDKGNDHEWITMIKHMTNGSSCPVCTNKKIVSSNCLSTLNPELAMQWHVTKNGQLSPYDIGIGSSKKVWWKCNKAEDHEWLTSVTHRSKGSGCPICSGKQVVLSNCLATTHPIIAKQWHPTKNRESTPYDVGYGSDKKVWWKCNKAEDHEWLTKVTIRSTGSNCPMCSGKQVVLSNCLVTLSPELAKQWHPTKNGKLTPYDITVSTAKKVWWKCDKERDHEWFASVSSRSAGSNCPMCSGKQVVLSNCLVTLSPELAKQWHPTKNGKLTPYDITIGTAKKVWWKCDKEFDHEWFASVSSRSAGSNCPMCSGKQVVLSNCLATIHPNIAKQWHPTKNGELTSYDVTIRSGKNVWWKCDKGNDHEWITTVYKRSIGRNCHICSNQAVVDSNCLATTHPKIANQWHPTKNGKLTPYDVVHGSLIKVWWKCDKEDDHEWFSPINRITRGGGCSVCRGLTVVKSNSLSNTHPDIAKKWHPTKNKGITPDMIIAGSHKVFWWKCKKGKDHEWRSSVKNLKNSDGGCSVCRGFTVVKSNSLATINPKLAKQWHPTKNGELTPYDVTIRSGKSVWWKCNKGGDHEWKTTPHMRHKRNCPYCTLTPQSKQELTITFELTKLFINIDPKGLKTKLDGRLRAIDIFIPKLNLCIEFDGSYWHKDKRDIDKIKSEMLFEEGFKLIRVREEPLDKIYDTDVISKLPYNGKQVTNDVLSMIMSKFELDVKLVSKIKEYQSKDGLQNKKGLDEYIDMILTEKANMS